MFKGLAFFTRESWKYDKRYVLYAVAAQWIAALTPVLASVMPKYILDELMGLGRPAQLGLWVAAFAGYAMAASMLSGYLGRQGFQHRCQVDASFWHDQNRRVMQADYAQVERPAFWDMQKKAEKFLTCDWHGFGYLLDCALRVLGALISLACLAAILSVLRWWVVAAYVAFACLCTAVEHRAKKRAMALSLDVTEVQRKWLYVSGVMKDSRYGKEIRQGGMASWLLQREKTCYTQYLENQNRQNRLYLRAGAIRSGVTFLQQVLAYAVLIDLALRGRITIGTFSMCISAVTAFAAALQQLMDNLLEIHAYDVYYEQLEEYLAIPSTLRTGTQPAVERVEEITFDNVGFRYPGATTWALRQIHLTLRRGEHLALVGENGSGKTTLIKLLCRLYDPTEGRILINGRDIREMDYDAYQRLFATVFQDFQLFEFTLRDNLTLGRDVDDAALMGILRQVGLERRVQALPHGLDTYVGRSFSKAGFQPSGGEAQKIALARALCKAAPVIILDEPTAALDARAENELYGQFSTLIQQRTAVYITHRLSSCQFCDRILVLHNGTIAEQGTHDALMSKHGVYARLYALQAQYYAQGREEERQAGLES